MSKPWNKGMKENPKTTAKRSESMKKWWSIAENRKLQSEAHLHMQGDKHNSWAGDSVGYYGLHRWVAKTLGKPQTCQQCNRTDRKRYEWANVSGEYVRKPSDWIRLCRSCHIAFDKLNGFWGNSVPYRGRRIAIS